MARDPNSSPEEQVRRSVARTIANLTVLAASLAVLGAWSYFGFYQLEPGQAAVILRFGKYVRTEGDPGLRWHWPPPLEGHEIVNVASIDKEEFGTRHESQKSDDELRHEASMQTSDNNIVHVGFVVQYRIKDAFASRYRVADPRAILRDAAQSAVRGVVGHHTIDGVLTAERGAVQAESEESLQESLDRYESGLQVVSIELQEVSPPVEVRSAFDDVLAATQDSNRAVNEAEGYANEVLPKARAEAIETVESAKGYREAKVAIATGEANRFRSITAEYQKAPDVVRTRLFLEAMEEVLPQVRTVIVEPGTAVMPYLPLDAPVPHAPHAPSAPSGSTDPAPPTAPPAVEGGAR